MRLDGLAEQEARRQFTEFFRTRYGVVRRTAYLMCGDWHRADDLTQTAFLRLAMAWPQVRDRQSLDAFVRTCLIRGYLLETRRAWYRRESSYAEPPDEPAADGDPGETVTRRVLFARALRSLPPRQRVTLICRYYEGLDVAETAVVMRCSEGTVKSQTARGLAALRRALGEVELPPALAQAVEALP
jgi:RNA polymerase sigma-70 factor (sigma-E family)